MADEDAELELMIQYRDLMKRCLEAKQAHQQDPTDAAKAQAWREAKNERSEFRAYWRGVNRYQQDLAVAGDPEAAAAVYGNMSEGDAIAAPAPHGMGVKPSEV